MSPSIVALLAVCFVSGCTVYKSSDRDDFNSNGKAKAPTQKATTVPLSEDDQDLLANPCAALTMMTTNDVESLFGPAPRLTMVNQVSPKTSTCLITNGSANQQDMSAVSVLACSWKPVDGQPIAVSSDALSIQTTEDDLRASGFDVVSTSVARGATLRMNCESYVPTNVLLNDRKFDEERGASDLAYRFAVFAIQLNRQTMMPVSRQ